MSGNILVIFQVLCTGLLLALVALCGESMQALKYAAGSFISGITVCFKLTALGCNRILGGLKLRKRIETYIDVVNPHDINLCVRGSFWY